jgi:hypothetical protein
MMAETTHSVVRAISAIWVALVFSVPVAIAQTTSSVQAPERPGGYPIVGPVMLAGSDQRSRDFERDVLPTVIGIIRAQLASGRIFTDPGDYVLDPKYLAVGERPLYPMRVYFIDEGAGFRNSLGISIERYTTGDRSPIMKWIFPSANKPGNHSLFSPLGPRTTREPLHPGDFVDLPNVRFGDTLNFFLMSNALRGGRTVLWNDPDWNPAGAQQIIAFRVPGHPTFMIVSFEDIPATATWQDLDFEDVIIVVDHGYDFESVAIPH